MKNNNRAERLAILVITFLLLLASALYVLWKACSVERPDKHPNICFILIDTLRPDHLGCYGYGRQTSPRIDKIAEDGVLFTHFRTVCPWTIPTISACFLGRYPLALFKPSLLSDMPQDLPKGISTLAEILRKNGYTAIGMSDHLAINKAWGYGRGFDPFIELFLSYQAEFPSLSKGSDPGFIAGKFRETLSGVAGKNFFLYLHLVYPHDPYTPPRPYADMFGAGSQKFVPEQKDGLINMYDGEIRYTDTLVGRLFDILRQKKLLGSTYVVITSDHGEGFWEHGFCRHGNSLYPELINIPLIIYPPGGTSKGRVRVNDLASNIDIFATILDMAKIRIPSGVSGESLLRFTKPGGGEKTARYVFSENQCHEDFSQMSCQDDRFQYIYSLAKGTAELYDVRDDPGERKDLSHGMNTAEDMKEALMRHKKEADAKRAVLPDNRTAPDKETLDRLRSLGYVQ